jgi:ubiquinone/menaquinone biosynthesis C-methylase UbiE
LFKLTILDYFGRTNTSNLHAFGMKATLCLENKLNCRPNEKIFEFGFGTGNTIVHLAAGNRSTLFYGADVSEIMYRKALSRIKFTGLKNRPELHLIKKLNPLPFENDFFDKIYIESVLAILHSDELNFVLNEIVRILKSGGKIVFNETIWLPNTSAGMIDSMNKKAKNDFGLIQASSDYPYPNDWINLLHKYEFENITVSKLNDLVNNTRSPGFSFARSRSKWFTYLGKTKGRFNAGLRKEWNRFEKAMKINNKEIQSMEGLLFEAYLKK